MGRSQRLIIELCEPRKGDQRLLPHGEATSRIPSREIGGIPSAPPFAPSSSRPLATAHAVATPPRGTQVPTSPPGPRDRSTAPARHRDPAASRPHQSASPSRQRARPPRPSPTVMDAHIPSPPLAFTVCTAPPPSASDDADCRCDDAATPRPSRRSRCTPSTLPMHGTSQQCRRRSPD